MPLYRPHATIILFAFAVALFIMPMRAGALSVDNIRFGAHQQQTRLVIDLDARAEFRAFVLANPYRLVIDMPSFSWNAGRLEKSANATVTAVRQGNLQPGISRVVFDLNKPVSIHNAFTLPAQGGKPNRLVIDFKPVPVPAFHAEKSRVFGKLSVNDAATSYANRTDNQARTTSKPPIVQTARGAVPVPLTKPSAQSLPTRKPLIIIDPGHGGVDPGAIGHNNLKEKHVVLALGKELRKQLESTGQYRVEMTRESDKFIKLKDRVKFARNRSADLFISIHADSLEKKHVRGASVYTLSEKASDKQTARLAARENKADLIAGIDLSIEDEEVASILVDLAMRDTTNQAKFFANNVVLKFKNNGVRVLENTHRHAGFAVLKAPDVPSILVEAGFMSNRQEAELLNTKSYRKKVVKALVRGVDAYFEQVKKNQRI